MVHDRPDPILPVHCRLGGTYPESWSLASPKHRRYTDIRLLLAITRRRMMARVTECVAEWIRSNCLQLNDNKTEFMWCTTVRLQHRLPTVDHRFAHCAAIVFSSRPRCTVYIDSDLSMQSHVRRTASCCFAVLRHLRTIRRQLTTAVFQSLIVALILSRLDYCNSVLSELPACLLQCLQSV